MEEVQDKSSPIMSWAITKLLFIPLIKNGLPAMAKRLKCIDTKLREVGNHSMSTKLPLVKTLDCLQETHVLP